MAADTVRAGATAEGNCRVVLAITEHPLRAGIRSALELGGLEVVGACAGAAEALALCATAQPHVCVIAAELAGGGLECARQLRATLPDVRILIMTEHESEEQLYEALQVGIEGYLGNTTPVERLPHAVSGLTRGEAALSRRLTAQLMRDLHDRRRPHRLQVPAAGREVELTAREFEVVKRMRQGLGTAQIAAQLQISQVTVRRHISAVLHKLGVRSRRQALELLGRLEGGAGPGAR